MNTIPYGRQSIDASDIEAVVDVLKSDWITQGPAIEKFESRVADWINVHYAVAFSSGTAALHGAMNVAGVTKGKEAITSPITFLATPNSAIYCGGRPVFVDIDPQTYCIDIEKIPEAITDKTRVIAPVDMAGFPVEIQPILDCAEDHDCIVIEDAAHALGAHRNGRNVGVDADMTMFSFHPVKHITTGEGGVIVTDNEEYADKLREFRNHGITKNPQNMEKNDGPWYYEMRDLGYNYRITDIQCALGLSQILKLESFLIRRNEIASKYDDAFACNPNIKTPLKVPNFSRHAYHIYPLLLTHVSRKDLFLKLRENGISCQVHYIPVYRQPYYRKNFGYRNENFPVSEWYYENEITIPLYPAMSDPEVQYVIDTVLTLTEELS